MPPLLLRCSCQVAWRATLYIWVRSLAVLCALSFVWIKPSPHTQSHNSALLIINHKFSFQTNDWRRNIRVPIIFTSVLLFWYTKVKQSEVLTAATMKNYTHICMKWCSRSPGRKSYMWIIKLRLVRWWYCYNTITYSTTFALRQGLLDSIPPFSCYGKLSFIFDLFPTNQVYRYEVHSVWVKKLHKTKQY